MEGMVTSAKKKPSALAIWGVCVVLLLGPSALVWIVRGAAYAAQCMPGPEPCHGMLLGAGLRDALALAWGVSTNTLLPDRGFDCRDARRLHRAPPAARHDEPSAAADPGAGAADARGLHLALRRLRRQQ